MVVHQWAAGGTCYFRPGPKDKSCGGEESEEDRRNKNTPPVAEEEFHGEVSAVLEVENTATGGDLLSFDQSVCLFCQIGQSQISVWMVDQLCPQNSEPFEEILTK